MFPQSYQNDDDDDDDDDDCGGDDDDSGSECSFACFIFCHRLCFSVLISALPVRSASTPPTCRRFSVSSNKPHVG